VGVAPPCPENPPAVPGVPPEGGMQEEPGAGVEAVPKAGGTDDEREMPPGLERRPDKGRRGGGG